jgi:hypothetical protein
MILKIQVILLILPIELAQILQIQVILLILPIQLAQILQIQVILLILPIQLAQMLQTQVTLLILPILPLIPVIQFQMIRAILIPVTGMVHVWMEYAPVIRGLMVRRVINVQKIIGVIQTAPVVVQ